MAAAARIAITLFAEWMLASKIAQITRLLTGSTFTFKSQLQ